MDPRDRINALFDPGSFAEIEHTSESRWLRSHGIEPLPGDGIIAGVARLAGRKVLVVAQDGGFLGGAISEIHAHLMCAGVRAACKAELTPIVLLLDSGGVRLHEAAVAEIGLGRVMRAILELRNAGGACVAVADGKVGCFGGSLLVAGVCDELLLGENQRMGVSGPKVLELMSASGRFNDDERLLATESMTAAWRQEAGDVERLLPADPEKKRAILSAALASPRWPDKQALVARQRALEDRIGAGTASGAISVADALPGFDHASGLRSLAAAADEWDVRDEAGIATGTALIGQREVIVVGATTSSCALGVSECVRLSGALLDAIEARAGAPILLLADAVQAISLDNERAGLAPALAHLAECIAHARHSGHRTVALLSTAGTAATLAVTGFMTNELHALPGSEIHALPPNVVQRFVPGEKTAAMSTTVEDFLEFGGVRRIWSEPFADCLRDAFAERDTGPDEDSEMETALLAALSGP